MANIFYISTEGGSLVHAGFYRTLVFLQVVDFQLGVNDSSEDLENTDIPYFLFLFSHQLELGALCIYLLKNLHKRF